MFLIIGALLFGGADPPSLLGVIDAGVSPELTVGTSVSEPCVGISLVGTVTVYVGTGALEGGIRPPEMFVGNKVVSAALVGSSVLVVSTTFVGFDVGVLVGVGGVPALVGSISVPLDVGRTTFPSVGWNDAGSTVPP